MNQLELIFRSLGSPVDETWPEAKSLPNFIPWKRVEAPVLRYREKDPEFHPNHTLTFSFCTFVLIAFVPFNLSICTFICTSICTCSSQFPEDLDALALDLLSKMVQLNPAHRITAADALAHAYFSSEPLQSTHENLYKPAKRRERVRAESAHKLLLDFPI